MGDMSCMARNGLDGILLVMKQYVDSGTFRANRPNINSVSSSLTEPIS